jgi:EAL domain-containing protein (putative c-di-GMP-specific phosphodiesterase class I)/ActR/RegA family two-component response regulator
MTLHVEAFKRKHVEKLDEAAQTVSSLRIGYVLDDDRVVGKMICRLLKSVGVCSRHFDTPVPFLAAVKTRPPEVALVDLTLGDTDGVEIIRRLASLRFGGSVLLTSGRDEQLLYEVQEIGLAHGLAMLPPLHKPFTASALRQALATAPRRGKRASSAEPQPVMIDLKQALTDNWLELWYQPKIQLRTNWVSGAEALLRVRHPDRGVLAPSSVLPRSDDPDHFALFEFVLGRAAKQWSTLAEQGIRLPLSINVPVSVFQSGDITRLIRKLLPQNEHFPGLLLELTEDEVIRDGDLAREMGTQLKLYNVLLSIDDFGSAAASLSRLQDLPFAELKLDRAFVAGCAADPRRRAICDAAVKLGHDFNAEVCAEGVESVDDLAILHELGFDTAQGYLLGRPMPADQLSDWMRGKAVAAPRAASRTAPKSRLRVVG